MEFLSTLPQSRGNLRGHCTAWTQYIQWQPIDVPVPTLWSESERELLNATSLRPAVEAKMELLSREFEQIRAKVIKLPFWQDVFSNVITLGDWRWLDALFRSRSFDLPYSGESMIPCLDMVNHDNDSSALFEQDAGSGTINLLLRNGQSIPGGEEITINYGKTKSAAEMLFNYGFIDSSSTTQILVLPLDTVLDEESHDPLFQSKLDTFNAVPMLELKITARGNLHWTSPFLYLLCVTEEDGLSFKTGALDGSDRPRILWRGADVTRFSSMFDVLINASNLKQIVEYRATSIIMRVVTNQLEKLRSTTPEESVEREAQSIKREVREHIYVIAMKLRAIEELILTKALQGLLEQRTHLWQEEAVQEVCKISCTA